MFASWRKRIWTPTWHLATSTFAFQRLGALHMTPTLMLHPGSHQTKHIMLRCKDCQLQTPKKNCPMTFLPCWSKKTCKRGNRNGRTFWQRCTSRPLTCLFPGKRMPTVLRKRLAGYVGRTTAVWLSCPDVAGAVRREHHHCGAWCADRALWFHWAVGSSHVPPKWVLCQQLGVRGSGVLWGKWCHWTSFGHELD